MSKFRILKLADGTYVPQVRYLIFFWTGISYVMNYGRIKDGFVFDREESIHHCKVPSLEEAAMVIEQFISDRDSHIISIKVIDIIEIEDT